MRYTEQDILISYRDAIEYSIDNNHHIIYSPLQNKISVVSNELYKFLSLNNGVRSLGEISELLCIDMITINKYIQKLKSHFDNTAQWPNFSENSFLDCWFHVSNVCNLSCPYCYIVKENDPDKPDCVSAVIDSLFNSCKKRKISELHIRFAGGEPFLNKNIIDECIKYAQSVCGTIKVKYGVVTNGTLINDESLEWIVANNISVAISLDGTALTHDKTRYYGNGLGTFNDVIHAISCLCERNIQTTVMVTVTKYNLHDLPSLTLQLIKYKNIHFRYSLEKCTASNRNLSLIDMQNDITQVIGQCIDIMEAALSTGNTSFCFQFCDFNFGRPHTRACGVGTKSIAVDRFGNGSICGMGFYNKISLCGADDVYTAIQQQYSNIVNSKIQDSSFCNACAWKYVCAGGCPLNNILHHGDTTPSPYCPTFKSILPKLIKLEGERMYYSTKKGRDNFGST